MKPYLWAFTGVLFLTACGGGGSGRPIQGSSTEPHVPVPIQMPRLNSVSPGLASLPLTAPETIAAYLREHVEDGQFRELLRFSSPPQVHFDEHIPDPWRALTQRAIDAVNAWLPYDQHVTIGDDVSRNMYRKWPRTGDIYVGEQVSTTEHPRSNAFVEAKQGRGELEATRIQIRPHFETLSEAHQFSILMHEVLHAMGLLGHVTRTHYPGTMMGEGLPLFNRVLEIDGLALLTTYTRLPPAKGPKALSANALGPWAGDKALLAHTLETTCRCGDFGTNWINGYAVPWANGQVTTGTFAESGLTGSVEWTGQFVGFAPDSQAVVGDSRIAVELATMTGQADFTDMQYHDGGQWEDGMLGYTLTLDGNHFHSAGGSQGYTTGRFVGTYHEGAVGMVEHPHVTGAFGALRDIPR